MKIKIILVTAILMFTRAFSQGFVNLDFESANLTGYSPGNTIPTANAFPGWVVSAECILYGGFSLIGEAISIIDTNSPYILNAP
jgi:hypothetical protein